MPPAVLRVALPLPRPGLFDYLPPPDASAGDDWLGCRVRVRFGPRRLVGVVAECGPPAIEASRLRPVEARLDAAPLLLGEHWTSLRWLADYYHAPLGEVLALCLPTPLREGQPLPETDRQLWQARVGAQPRLREDGRPARLWAALAAGPLDGAALQALDAGWRPLLRRFVEQGWVEEIAPPAPRSLPAMLALSAAQQDAVAALRATCGFAPTLLQGVTGSGKTEVYLELLAEALDAGGQALVLVPEIGLTPQTVRRFRARLGDAVRVLHSGLADGERLAAWAALARGEPAVVVGTRSAALAPLPKARLIVVDEEHDASYKAQDGVRYSARDLALVRGRALGIPVLLGSATPSLETLAQVERGRYACLRLSERAGSAKPPRVEVQDLRAQRLRAGLSPASLQAIGDTLRGGGQVLVFRNRRGYAPALLCHDCGWTAVCARCDSPMTVHATGARLACHHCGAEAAAPPACPDCGSLGLQAQGQGTERLEETLLAAFPEWPVVRIDRGSTRRKDAIEALLERLGTAPGILVGTQMLAKGHDLPGLALVVVVGIDEGLFSADFRASERLAQLLVQVGGRAGRGARPGRVLLQTHHPSHPLLTTLLTVGYAGFATDLLDERRVHGYPPAAHWALLRAEALDEAAWRDFLDAAVALFDGAGREGVDLLGPLPAPKPRRAGYQRGQLLLSARQRPALQRLLARAWADLFELPSARRVRWSLDVDPIDLY